MSHYETRIAEILAAIPDTPQGRAQRAVYRQAVEPRVNLGDPDHFMPATWARLTLHDAKKRARLKGLEYGLTVAFLLRMLDRQHYACAVSGIPFSGRRSRESHKRPFWPSIDRIDCTKGYVEGNIRIVSVCVNTLLQDWGDDVWREVCAAAKRTP